MTLCSKRSCKAENNNKNIPKTRLSKKTLKRFYQYLMSQQLSTYIDLHYYYKNKGIKYENKNICKQVINLFVNIWCFWNFSSFSILFFFVYPKHNVRILNILMFLITQDLVFFVFFRIFLCSKFPHNMLSIEKAYIVEFLG